MFARGIKNLLARYHHTHVHHLEVIALQHHGYDVLADIVHVALHRRHHDLALWLAVAGSSFFRLDERHEVSHRLLHHASRFHHLRQEHLARTEQISDHVHAGHQRAFDHLDRELSLQPCFLGILDDISGDATHQCVGKAILHRALAPFEILNLFLAAAFHRFGQFDQPFARIGAAI